jgi:hypothetical protein
MTMTTATTTDEGSSSSSSAAEAEAPKNEKRLLRIAVGTKNPCKIDAVRHALLSVLGLSSSLDVELEIEGFSVSSGVADQPFGDVSVLCVSLCTWKDARL